MRDSTSKIITILFLEISSTCHDCLVALAYGAVSGPQGGACLRELFVHKNNQIKIKERSSLLGLDLSF